MHDCLTSNALGSSRNSPSARCRFAPAGLPDRDAAGECSIPTADEPLQRPSNSSFKILLFQSSTVWSKTLSEDYRKNPATGTDRHRKHVFPKPFTEPQAQP